MPRRADITLPYRVHTNRELGMMLRGEKPLACFADARDGFPEAVCRYLRLFDRYVAQGRLVRRDHVIPATGETRYDMHVILFALPDQAWRIDALIALKESLFAGAAWSAERERREGELLGYEDWQNDIWIGLLKQESPNLPPKQPEQLRDFKFPSGLGRDLATVNRRAADLAACLGVELERWEVDGLGWASGFALGPAAFPTMVVEQDHAVTLEPRRATTIAVDGREAASNGHRATLDRVIALLRLERGAISWVPENPVEWADEARRILETSGSHARPI